VRTRHSLIFCRSNAMFAGKSETAKRLVSIAEKGRKIKWACIRPLEAKRKEDSTYSHVTHAGGKAHCYYVDTAMEAKHLIDDLIDDGCGLFWIDEPFFWSNLTDFKSLVFSTLERANVIISSLTCTSEGEHWEELSMLLALADEIFQCNDAVCVDCCKVALRTWHVGREEKTAKVKVGGAADYIPVCVDCWNARAERAKVGAEKG